MKSTVLTRALALALMALAVVSLAWSSGSGEGAAAAGPSNLSAVGTFPIAKETVTMTGIIQQPPWVSSMTDNDQTRYFEKMANVKLDLQVVPSEGYADKLRIALATDDYPELIFSGAANNNNDVVTYGVKEKIYVPLTPFLKSMTNLSLRFAEMPELKTGATAPDGNIYVLPNFEGFPGHGAVHYKMWMNTEWLKAVGKAMPTTTDELYAVLQAFKTKDPNGNGKADEVPLSGAANTWAAEPYWSILNAFDYFEYALMKLKDGKFSSCADTAGIREGLKFLNRLYKDGLLDPASLTQDLAQLGQLGASRPIILGTFTAGHVGMGIDVADLQMSTIFQHVLPLKGPTGYRGVPAYGLQTVNGGHFAITDKAKNPELAARMMDLAYAENFMVDVSTRGDWIKADPGAVGVTGLPAKYKQNPNTDFSHGGKNNYWSGASAYGGIKNSKLYLQFAGDINTVANYEARLIRLTEEYRKYSAAYNQIMPMWASPEKAQELNNLFTPINDFVKSSFVQFITGAKDVAGADWDAYLAGLTKLGFPRYIQMYTEAYFAK